MKTATKLFSCFALAILLLAASAPAFAAANIVIVNVDGAGEGFNDPTAATPVGGNPGTTIGQQRLIAFQFAASVWGSILDSAVSIFVQASFDPLTCTATSATLGSAGAIQIFSNFPGREYDDTWYHVALANKLAGADLAPGPNNTTNDDIIARFNANLGQATCLPGSGFYYGLDANHGAQIDLVTVLLHEFGHGLGFANFVTEADGTQPNDLTDIFSVYTLDTSTGLHWSEMATNAQRAASAINSNKVVWDGINVVAAVPSVLQFGTPLLTVNSPSGLGPYRIGTATFGAVIASPGTTGAVVLALDPADAAGPTTFDACSPLTNAAAVAGKIAILDRGTCGFVVKVKNAQDAGAIAVLVADNAVGSPPAGMSGTDPTITIPSARVSQADGNTIKAAIAGGINVTLGVNLAIRAGADAQDHVLLNAPSPVVPGSSISHWDPIAFPNLLMEPAINTDLTHSVDLTRQEMIDIGWFSDGDGVPDGRDQCIGSSSSTTVKIGTCDSQAPNFTFTTGCRITDQVNDCIVNAKTSKEFERCLKDLTKSLKRDGIVTARQGANIEVCGSAYAAGHFGNAQGK